MNRFGKALIGAVVLLAVVDGIGAKVLDVRFKQAEKQAKKDAEAKEIQKKIDAAKDCKMVS